MFKRKKRIFKNKSVDYTPSDDMYVAPEDLAGDTGTVSEPHVRRKETDGAVDDTASLMLKELKSQAGISESGGEPSAPSSEPAAADQVISNEIPDFDLPESMLGDDSVPEAASRPAGNSEPSMSGRMRAILQDIAAESADAETAATLGVDPEAIAEPAASAQESAEPAVAREATLWDAAAGEAEGAQRGTGAPGQGAAGTADAGHAKGGLSDGPVSLEGAADAEGTSGTAGRREADDGGEAGSDASGEKINLGFRPVKSIPQYEGRFAHVGELTLTRNARGAHEDEPEEAPTKSKVEEETNDEAEPEVYSVAREPQDASDYDDLINWKSKLAHEASLFNRAFSMGNARTVVEAGSGSGRHSVMFAQWGMHVTGVESNDDLIDRARAYAEQSREEIAEARGDLRFMHGSLGSLSRVLGFEKVDALVCVEDNLLRTGSLTNLRVVLADFADCLVTGGVLVLGFSNYARLTQGKTRSTPPEVFDTTEGTKVFFRILDYPAGSSVVDIDQLALTRADAGTWSVESNHMQDLFVSSTGITRELIDAGFDVLELSGDYNGKEYRQFDDDSIVIIARRKRHRSSQTIRI